MISSDSDAVVIFFRLIVSVVIVPALSILIWYLKKLQSRVDEINGKQIQRLEELEKKQAITEKDQAVTTVMMHNLQEDIREIKDGLNKLLDRRGSSRNDKST